jgi:hypothetical protein
VLLLFGLGEDGLQVDLVGHVDGDRPAHRIWTSPPLRLFLVLPSLSLPVHRLELSDQTIGADRMICKLGQKTFLAFLKSLWICSQISDKEKIREIVSN